MLPGSNGSLQGSPLFPYFILHDQMNLVNILMAVDWNLNVRVQKLFQTRANWSHQPYLHYVLIFIGLLIIDIKIKINSILIEVNKLFTCLSRNSSAISWAISAAFPPMYHCKETTF